MLKVAAEVHKQTCNAVVSFKIHENLITEQSARGKEETESIY